MMFTDINQIDLKKYKRIFTVGCSFTRYRYATWADILAKEAGAELYNFGASGAGHVYITTVLNQIINLYNPGPDDLVAVMWTTFYREDRRIMHNWLTPGHIYSQGELPMEYVNKYVCPLGCTIRDLALIDNTVRMLENQTFDSVTMYSVAPKEQTSYAHVDTGDVTLDQFQLEEKKFLDLYQGLNEKIQPSIFSLIFNCNWGDEGYRYYDYDINSEEIFIDYHPTVPKYCAYLETIGFKISDSTKDFANDCHEKMLNVKVFQALEGTDWPWRHHAKWPI